MYTFILKFAVCVGVVDLIQYAMGYVIDMIEYDMTYVMYLLCGIAFICVWRKLSNLMNR